jgi:hypothetical protein
MIVEREIVFMTNNYTCFFCGNCGFGLDSGWNHRTASHSCTCINCATMFSIKGSQSHLGVVNDEICHLYQPIIRNKQRKKHRDRPTEFDTEVRIMVVKSSQEVKLATFKTGVFKTVTVESSTFELDNVTCPSCHKLGSLKISLEVGERCPICQIGNIEQYYSY